MLVIHTPPTPAGESVSESFASPNTSAEAKVPFPPLPEPALKAGNSAGIEGSTHIDEQSFVFPTHDNGHFLGGGLDELSRPVLAGYNFPPHPGFPSLQSPHLGSGLVGHSGRSSEAFTAVHNNSVDPNPPASMPHLPYYPASFDATPHHIYPHLPGQADFPSGPSYQSFAAPRESGFFRYGYDALVGQDNSGCGDLTYPSAGNLNLNTNFNLTNSMMPQSASGFGQPPVGYQASQQFGHGYGTAGANFGFVNSGSSFGQPHQANSMPHSSYTHPMNNMNDHGLGRTAGFLESGFSGNATLGSTQPPSTTYSFGPSNAPPFIDLTRFVWPSSNPVVKITNIPFNVSKDELAQFMRRNFLPHGNEYSGACPSIVAVHIIMERTNAKTQDCFIELASVNTKRVVLDRYNEDLQSSFPPKIGHRHVSIEDSDQGEMMKEIFPRAKCIAWGNVQCFPVKMYNLDPYGSGFNGFLTKEELFNLVRYTQDPTRNPYGTKCPQRTYETMIMTLNTYPWASPYHTFEDREKLWDAYLPMLQCLFAKVSEQGTIGLSSQLLETFVLAGINCPAFAGWQKHLILLEARGHNATYGLSSFAEFWPFECLSIPAGVSDQDLHNWLGLLTTGMVDKVKSMGTRAWYRRYLVVHLDAYDRVVFQVLDHARHIGFRDLARAEYEAMLYLVGRGWRKWFSVRGLDSDLSDMAIPDKSARMDVALDNQMHAVGVYAEGGVLGSKANAVNYLPNLIEDDGRPMSPGIDPILAEEDARAREAEYGPIQRMPSPALSDVLRYEDARAAAASPDIAEAPVQFNNPFQGPTTGGTSNVGSLVFGQMGDALADIEEDSGGMAINTPAAASAPISTARRVSKAIPIRVPEDGRISTAAKSTGKRGSLATSPKSKEKNVDNKGKGKEVQDPIGTPGRRQSAAYHFQVDEATSSGRVGKTFRSV